MGGIDMSGWKVGDQKPIYVHIGHEPNVSDNVNHPKHYTNGGVECIEALAAATVGKSGIQAVCVAKVIKYLWRYESKNGIEDVEKARWYLDRLIKELSGNGDGNEK